MNVHPYENELGRYFWKRQIEHEEFNVRRWSDKLGRATTMHKKEKYVKRIIAAQARILAIKLAHR